MIKQAMTSKLGIFVKCINKGYNIFGHQRHWLKKCALIRTFAIVIVLLLYALQDAALNYNDPKLMLLKTKTAKCIIFFNAYGTYTNKFILSPIE